MLRCFFSFDPDTRSSSKLSLVLGPKTIHSLSKIRNPLFDAQETKRNDHSQYRDKDETELRNRLYYVPYLLLLFDPELARAVAKMRVVADESLATLSDLLQAKEKRGEPHARGTAENV